MVFAMNFHWRTGGNKSNGSTLSDASFLQLGVLDASRVNVKTSVAVYIMILGFGSGRDRGQSLMNDEIVTFAMISQSKLVH